MYRFDKILVVSTLTALAVWGLTGCAALQALFEAPAPGEPSTMESIGQGLAIAAQAVTGNWLDAIYAIAAWKTGEAVLTKRGMDNVKMVIGSGVPSGTRMKAAKALAVGSHTPVKGSTKKTPPSAA